MAILWHEMWHEALEEASRQYFGDQNVEGMLATLLPLHKMMQEHEPSTLKEISFAQVKPRCLLQKTTVNMQLSSPLHTCQSNLHQHILRWAQD